jgi:hypothetical protein
VNLQASTLRPALQIAEYWDTVHTNVRARRALGGDMIGTALASKADDGTRKLIEAQKHACADAGTSRAGTPPLPHQGRTRVRRPIPSPRAAGRYRRVNGGAPRAMSGARTCVAISGLNRASLAKHSWGVLWRCFFICSVAPTTVEPKQ